METQDQFEQLKNKFRPAVDFLDGHDISVQALSVQDDRLLVRVVAPSGAVRDEIFERFRQIDPALRQVHLDIRLEVDGNVPSTGQTTVQSGGDTNS